MAQGTNQSPRDPFPEATAPSGRQYHLVAGDHEADVTEAGATLRAYRHRGRDVVFGFGADERAPAGAGQVLMPWPNRIRDGAYDFDGRRHQLALTEPARRNAIHGLVRWASWAAESVATDRVAMTYRLMAQDGYPFRLDLQVEYSLEAASGITVVMTATNRGVEPAPFGAGAHPYLSPPGGSVDDALLTVPAATTLETDDRAIPVGRRPVAGTDFDFRSPRPIGSTQLDTAFCDLQRDDDGLVRVTLSGGGARGGAGGGAGRGAGTQLWADAAFGYLMVFTGDALGPERRRRAVAVEPMTCAPNAFASGEGLLTLAPGETFVGRWGIRPGAD